MKLQRRTMVGNLEVEVTVETKNGLTHSMFTQYFPQAIMDTITAAAKDELRRLHTLPSDCVGM